MAARKDDWYFLREKNKTKHFTALRVINFVVLEFHGRIVKRNRDGGCS